MSGKICAQCQERPTWRDENFHSKFRRTDVCFTCAFWFDVLHEIENDETRMYFILGNEDHIEAYCFDVRYARLKPEEASFLGHGGRWFCITTKDGKEHYTNNLWDRGKVSAPMKSEFLDKINVKEFRTLTSEEAAEQREKL